MVNHTHDPAARSWVISAQQAGQDFPIQNLPLAVCRRADRGEAFRGGVAIGDQVVDLAALAEAGVLDGLALEAARAASAPSLNAFMAMGAPVWQALRHGLFDALHVHADASTVDRVQACLFAQADAEFAVPAQIGDYTDFYTSVHHATNIGKLFRPDSPLLPNYKWVPIGYHGRASSIAVSGQAFRRPKGQIKPADAPSPVMAPCQRLDFELELGIYVGVGNEVGDAIDIADAEQHVFGICLLNDWSARDIQAWEYQPLGPFLSKSFATTVSPWIVSMEALAPFRVGLSRPEGDPQPLPYLHSAQNQAQGALDIQLQVGLSTQRLREAGEPDAQLARTSYRHAYWSVAQLVTHHTVNGCDLRPGDLFGSGTLSGSTLDQAGALIELTEGGQKPVLLPNGEQRTFLLDGDAVVLRGWCEAPGAARIGFGECWGTVLPASP